MLNVDERKCFYCGTCASVCPQGAIELLDIGEVRIDENCVEQVCMKWNCRLCVKSCPVGAIYGV
jgi:ferredoxin